VNGIIHPAVRNHFFEWCERQQSPYVIHEAAILFESGFSRFMDYNILVTSDRETRIKRVMERDSIAASEVEKRIEKQWDDKKKASLSDVVIDNDKELLIPKIIEIDKRIKEYGKIW
jgi:dephospho-CoA kinase